MMEGSHNHRGQLQTRTTGSLQDSPAPHCYLFKHSSFLTPSVSRSLIKHQLAKAAPRQAVVTAGGTLTVTAISMAEAIVHKQGTNFLETSLEGGICFCLDEE